MSGRIFLLVAVLASMASLAVRGGPVSSQAPPQKCCLPKQVSMILSDLNTINSENITYLDMQIDYDAQKQVMLNYTLSSKTLVSKALIDYNKGMLYYVAAAYPTHCYKTPLNIPLIRCIPDDAEYLGSSYLGPMGAGQLPYDGWRFSYPGGMITMAFSTEGCVPILEGVSIPAENQSQRYMFLGYQPSLKDPSAFNLPDSCKQ